MNDEQAPTMYCDKHQNPTHVRCQRCHTPICPLCMVFGPLGQQCSDGNCERHLMASQRRAERRQKRHGGGRSLIGWIRLLWKWLIALVVLVTVADVSYHWMSGAPLQDAVSMVGEDYQLLVTCTTEVEVIWDFLRRPPQDNYSSMSDRYGDGWADRICNNSSSAALVLSPNTQAAVVRPSERHIELKRYMLGLINDERAKAGADPVVLGDNNAAQLHAESSLANCFLSGWGVDGLKHYMRYSLAGGYQSLDGGRVGLGYCITASDRYRAIRIREEILKWIDDTDFPDNILDPLDKRVNIRDKILDPLDKRVNIGLAWDTYNYRIVLQLEGDYVEYARLPTIENGILTMSGTVKNGAGFADERNLGVQIYYDQPPQPRTPGQLTRTSCYNSGLQIAALREPLTGNWYYDEHEFTKTYEKCPGPYLAPVVSIIVPWITALEWTTSADAFAVRADISDLLARHGDGVYSITVWGVIDGEDVVISRYSIFHGVTPPDTYDPDRYD